MLWFEGSSKTLSGIVPATSVSTYGISFHDDHFVVGITDRVYQKNLIGNAGFLMNTDKYRLTNMYAEDFSDDPDIALDYGDTEYAQVRFDFNVGFFTVYDGFDYIVE